MDCNTFSLPNKYFDCNIGLTRRMNQDNKRIKFFNLFSLLINPHQISPLWKSAIFKQKHPPSLFHLISVYHILKQKEIERENISLSIIITGRSCKLHQLQLLLSGNFPNSRHPDKQRLYPGEK